MKESLYRHFSESGELLYIGISINPMLRTYQHQKNSSWFPEVSRISIEWHKSSESAKAEECRAILAEKPKYNIRSAVDDQGNKKHKTPKAKPFVVTDKHVSVAGRIRILHPTPVELSVSKDTLTKILKLVPVRPSTIERVSARLDQIELDKNKAKIQLQKRTRKEIP